MNEHEPGKPLSPAGASPNPAGDTPSRRSQRQRDRLHGLKERKLENKGKSKSPITRLPGQSDQTDYDDEDESLYDDLIVGKPDAGPATWDLQRVQEQAEMFANRLKKRRAHLWKWARRTGVTCFRIYDRDIPELPFQVDEYDRYLHIAQIVRVRSIDEEHAKLWTAIMVDAAGRALGVDKSRVFVKDRIPQKGTLQYEKKSGAGVIIKAQENGLEFEVNLSDYLDTGLFLDHRDTRAMVRDLALGCRVLNLFAYTGSFSVYAAQGGAQSTTSVDLSNTYCDWAARNLALNRFVGKTHQVICEDVLAWVPLAAKRGDQFDIIILDPPTFSNSKSMTGYFDLQRDHAELINQLLRLLSKNGIIVFSNNFRKFKLDTAALRSKYVDDITFKSIPEDFKNKRPHKCWVIKRTS